MSQSHKTIICIGAGPGIGRSVTALFASKGYSNVVLIARRAGQLETEAKAVQGAAGGTVNVHTYAVDVADTEAFTKVLADAENTVGKPDCVFYNAARVLPSTLLSHEVTEIDYDFRINVSALYVTVQKFMPHLLELAKASGARPALIVTSSLLPQHPIPQLFALSLVKAAQRNMMQSLEMTYGPQGVFVGVINIQGQVSPDHEVWNPTNIAQKTWDWFSGGSGFEVVI